MIEHPQKKDMNKSAKDLDLQIDNFVSSFIEKYKEVLEAIPIKEKNELPFFTDRYFSIKAYVSQDENVLLIFSESNSKSIEIIPCKDEKEFLKILDSKMDELGLLLRVNHLDSETGKIIGERKAKRDIGFLQNKNNIMYTSDQIEDLKSYIDKILSGKRVVEVGALKSISDQVLKLEKIIKKTKVDIWNGIEKTIFDLIPDNSLRTYGIVYDTIEDWKSYINDKISSDKKEVEVGSLKNISNRILNGIEEIIKQLKVEVSSEIEKAIFKLKEDSSLRRYIGVSDTTESYELRFKKIELELDDLRRRYKLLFSILTVVMLPIVLAILVAILAKI